MDPLEWGWKIINGHLRPVTTLKAAAPDDLLHLICCCCKDDCTTKCECFKSGLKCSTMCANCAGHGCSNRDIADEIEPEEDFLVMDEEINLEQDTHREVVSDQEQEDYYPGMDF